MTITSVIEIQHLSKRFGDAVAVDDVSFDVAPGEVFGFMGHNGAGKTTTLRMLLGLTRPSAGEARVLGHDVVRESLTVRRQTGFLPGSYALPKDMTARSFLRYVAAMFGASGPPVARRIDELLEQFDLGAVADKRLGGFSTGMTQKVGLAQALLHHPRVLLLDEPTSGLDPIGRHELLQHIRRLADERSVAVLFSTHILSDIEAVCERVAVLHRGRLIAAGELARLKREHGKERMDDLYLALAAEAA